MRAPFAFAPPLDRVIHALKFDGRVLLGRALGLLLAEHLADEELPIDAIVAVPLSAHRLRERGYNQAFEIARPLARELGLPLLMAGIARRRHTCPQTDLTAAGRRANMRGAFVVRRPFEAARIAIVDDVITTGATLNALAAALLAAGAAAVEGWAVARTAARLAPKHEVEQDAREHDAA